MTRRSENQSYEDTLNDAVRDMHQQIPRGNQPSGRAWSKFAQEAGIPVPTLESGQASANSATAEISRNHKKRTRSNTSARSNSYLGWSTWLAVAIIVALVGASINFLAPDNGGNDNTSDHSIALAPGTPDVWTFPNSSIPVATPLARLNADISAFGPEYACDAEPLTEEQVFDIVMNPYRERVRRGSDNAPPLGRPFESQTWPRYLYADYSDYVPVNDPEIEASLIETSNEFWNCLMTGTSLQVWGMMDPSLVQEEILEVYPVVRDEAVLRQHIREWGPRLHRESLYKIFPTVASSDPIEVSMTADESYGAIIVKYAAPNFDGSEDTVAQVTMMPHSDSLSRGRSVVLIDFIRAADGSWWATKHSWNFP